MKSYSLKISIILILILNLSSFAYSQDQNELVPVTEQKINGKTVYTFVDQRNIPDENIDVFTKRISSLYSNVEKITFDKVDRKFSLHFIAHPEKKELENVFGHFNVNKYTLK